MRKQTLRSLSMSYQKEDGRGHTWPSFFWYDNDKDLKVCFLMTHLNYQVKRLMPNLYGTFETVRKCYIQLLNNSTSCTDFRLIKTLINTCINLALKYYFSLQWNVTNVKELRTVSKLLIKILKKEKKCVPPRMERNHHAG